MKLPTLYRELKWAAMCACVLAAAPVQAQRPPSDCRRILMDASRPFTFEGRTGARVPDALRAVEIARAGRTGAQLAASNGSRR
jgi:hypothetical protein